MLTVTLTSIYFEFQNNFSDFVVFELQKKYSPFGGVSRISATSKMEFYVKCVNVCSMSLSVLSEIPFLSVK